MKKVVLIGQTENKQGLNKNYFEFVENTFKANGVLALKPHDMLDGDDTMHNTSSFKRRMMVEIADKRTDAVICIDDESPADDLASSIIIAATQIGVPVYTVNDFINGNGQWIYKAPVTTEMVSEGA